MKIQYRTRQNERSWANKMLNRITALAAALCASTPTLILSSLPQLNSLPGSAGFKAMPLMSLLCAFCLTATGAR